MKVKGVFCHSCGYCVHTHPGKTCRRKKWHKPCKGSLSNEWHVHFPTSISVVVPAWVRARLRVNAERKGRTLSKQAAEVLEKWAKKHGGIP